MVKKLLICTLLVSFSIITNANDLITRKIDSIMKLANARGIFNGNVLVARKGKIIYEGSYGFADGSRINLLTAAHKFDIGSVSKEFNGAAIMLLKQRNLLNLDDALTKFFPELPGWAAKIKVGHLLTYTSGIPIFDGTSMEGDSLIMANLKSLKALNFEPGTAYIYNHYNVFLQMRIVERLSGLSYAQFVKKYILIPCGMKGAEVNLSIDHSEMAKAFDQNFQYTPYFQKMTGWVRLTASDLYQWSRSLYNYQLLSKASFKELASNFPGGESSLGTVTFAGDTIIRHRHQGSNSNYETLLYSDLKKEYTIVLMTNNQQMKVDGIKNAIFAALANEAVIVPKKSVYLEIREKMLADVDSGIMYYQKLKSSHQDSYDFSFEVGDLLSTGKYLLRRAKYDDAIKVFQLAVLLNAKPADLAYGYELIGEASLKKGDKINALLNYKKAVNLDSNNKNAAGILQQLNNNTSNSN
jgi:CubicO group peptidase (beta-lactamase class C family)